jgi:glucose-6-phosphate dehydrogenase assembly protein OpcA
VIDESQLASLGLEVAVGDIDSQLVRLFTGGDEDAAAPHQAGIARASLLNLAVYTEDVQAAAGLSKTVGDLTRETACRAILILADPAGSPAVRSWVQAHCRLSDQGEKTVCTEQVSFLLAGADASLVRNTVFAHLDSDLPLVFWWRGELSEVFEERLHSRIDRFIFDSSTWRQPAIQLLRLQAAIEESGGSFVPHDLSYTRGHPIRSAIARVFDDAQARRALDQLGGFEITHRPGHRLSALWLIAWLAARLGGRLKAEAATGGERFLFDTTRWGTLAIRIRESAGAAAGDAEAIGEVAIDLGEAGRIAIHHVADSGFWRVAQELTCAPPRERLFPGHPRTEADLIGEILVRAGRNRAMIEAMPLLRQLTVRP